jgi:hypothetical protein
MFSNRNTGFKPLNANNQIQNFVSDMYVIQDVQPNKQCSNSVAVQNISKNSDYYY